MNAMSRWAETITADSRVLLIVNSQSVRRDEIEQATTAIAARTDFSRVSCIAPASLKTWLIQLGLSAANILPARLHGVDLDLAYFLETPRAIRWAAVRRPTVVLGTEPYAPNNEEVKGVFELHAAALVGAASFVAHSLPDDRVFCFDVTELWLRAARRSAMDQHCARVQAAMVSLERAWKDPTAQDAAILLSDLAGRGLDRNQAVVVDASKRTYDRLSRSLAAGLDEEHSGGRLLVSPAGRWPLANVLPLEIEPVTSTEMIAANVCRAGARLAVRGVAASPYSTLLMSPPMQLKAGDAAVAEGKVYRGGVTIGLIVDGQWASRIDVDDPGSFMAVAVATVNGPHILAIANCVRGEDQRNAVALHRFGWTRRVR
jgi:hypothetical protein